MLVNLVLLFKIIFSNWFWWWSLVFTWFFSNGNTTHLILIPFGDCARNPVQLTFNVVELLIQAIGKDTRFTQTGLYFSDFTSRLDSFWIIRRCEWLDQRKHFYNVTDLVICGNLTFFKCRKLFLDLDFEGSDQIVYVLLNIKSSRLLQIIFKSLLLLWWNSEWSLFLAVNKLLKTLSSFVLMFWFRHCEVL